MKTISNNQVAGLVNPEAKDPTAPHTLSINPIKWVGEPKNSAEELWDFETLNIPHLWAHYGVRGEGVNVVVIDSGIAKTHTTFAHHSLITSKSLLPGIDSVVDGTGHGTWVCGKIAGQGIGILPRCRLYVLRVFDESGTGSSDFTTNALSWVLNNIDRPHLINMSLGGSILNEKEHQVILNLQQKGCLIAAAMGNQGTSEPMYPAAFENVLAVGALDRTAMKLADFSNWGDNVQLVAPGVACYSSYLNGKFRQMEGTSMATPIVVGVAGLGFSWLEKTAPYLSLNHMTAMIKASLKASCTDLGPAGKDNRYGWGAINAEAFMVHLASQPLSGS